MRLSALLLLAACSERFPAPEDTGRDTTPHVDTAPDETGGDTADTDTGDISDAPLELCINEIMPDNEASAQDETLAYADWIELHNPGDDPVALDGWTISDFRLEPDKHVLGGGLAIPPGGFLVLWADALPETGSDHLAFKLGADGGEVALFAPDGRGSIVTYGPMAADFSLARVPDCCTGDDCLTYDFRGSPGESNVEPVYEEVPLLAAGSTWKYWDQGGSPGAAWSAATGYDDAAWPSGTAPLGYGDTHVVTPVGYGGNDAAKHVTTWFRTTFTAPAVTLASLKLALLRDDGARVFLNGVEVARDNLPDGDLTDATLATAAISGADETAYWEFDVDPTVLVGGTNVLAVEVHQSSQASSDLGFDLSLTGEILVTP